MPKGKGCGSFHRPSRYPSLQLVSLSTASALLYLGTYEVIALDAIANKVIPEIDAIFTT